MKSPPNTLRLLLHAQPDQHQRLQALQLAFARACNALAPVVAQTRCWNRVALHHLAYRQLRAQFPELGSQMACNAIYSVSRTARIVYQHPNSPFNLQRLGDRPLPLLQFSARAPVYFDRHTLSLKDGVVSLFTLDGRMRFELNLPAAHEKQFREAKLRELVLLQVGGQFTLNFAFGEAVMTDTSSAANLPAAELLTDVAGTLPLTPWPEYILVQSHGQTDGQPLGPEPPQSRDLTDLTDLHDPTDLPDLIERHPLPAARPRRAARAEAAPHGAQARPHPRNRA